MVSQAQNRLENSLICYQKSLVLLEFIEEEDKTYSDKREERKRELKEQISILTKGETSGGAAT